MSWRQDPGARRRGLVRLIDVLVGWELAWLGLHHVSLAWCAHQVALYGFPLPFVRWSGSADWHFSPALMAIDLVAYAAMTVPLVVVPGLMVRSLWPRLVLLGLLAPLVLLDTALDALGANLHYLEAVPPVAALDAVHPWVGARFPYTDPRCGPTPFIYFQF